MKRLILLFVLAIGCSSGTSSSERDDFIAQVCQRYMPCCAAAGKPSDGSACRSFLGAFAGQTYDAAAGKACLGELDAQKSSPSFCDGNFTSKSTPSCGKALSSTGGTKKPGETCESDSECAPSSEGDVNCQSLYLSGGSSIRKCQVLVAGKAGDTPCVGTVDGNVTSYETSGDTDVLPKAFLCDVANGVRCDSTRKCVAIPKLGEACDGFGSNTCTKDAYCDSTAKKCVARVAIGAACDTFSSNCVSGAYCDSTSKQCTKALADGAPCSSSTPCASHSCVNGKCGGSIDLGTAFLCGG